MCATSENRNQSPDDSGSRAFLLALEERDQRRVRHLHDLEADAGNVADGVALSTEARHQHFVVLLQMEADQLKMILARERSAPQ